MAKKTAPAGGKGGGGGIVGFLLATVMALAVGGGFGFFLDGHLKGAAPVEEVKDAAAKDEKPKPAVSASAKLISMAPMVVNLAEPKDAWIRIEASMLIEGGTEGADVLAAQLGEDFVAYLRTATLVQFEGPSGFQNLREDLMDRATIRDKARIKDVIIHGVVIE
ncbi:flagellar basal body-associated FliL family protein [Hyphomicrobium sp.]|uniref:flagellar basal body-associated FliL family protein n=1 Tax=Hyphomicrobium sp. TaxID=82 RepID=UPI003F6FD928